MTTILDSRATRWALALLGAAAITVLGLSVGRVIPSQPQIAIVAALAVLALGVTAAEPAAIPLLAMPLLPVVYRVGGGGLGLSVSDVALFAATLAALVFAPRPFSPALRNLLWLNALYQFATLFTVIANPYPANVIEWFHAWMLVSGALIVGWTLGSRGFGAHALTILLLTASALALVVVVQGAVQFAQGDFAAVYPSWPYGMHKNFAGCVLGFAAVIAYARPAWMGWTRGWALTVFWLTAVALMLTQSRQAIVALAVALLVIAFRRGELQRRSRAILLAVIPALAIVTVLIRDQVDSGNQFNSVFQRLTWYEDSLAAWGRSPWVGNGLRYWSQGIGGLDFQPPQVFLEVLASAGVIGVVAFVGFMLGTLILLWRAEPVFGTLAAALVLERFVQGQFDLFWVAVQVSIPFAVVGICLGVEAQPPHPSAQSAPGRSSEVTP